MTRHGDLTHSAAAAAASMAAGRKGRRATATVRCHVAIVAMLYKALALAVGLLRRTVATTL